ncbi:YggS family pyridoxal phosphate-dependent enzyme [Clostridium sp. WILCCON 0269]|uniref:Pyridoxal phosphate homeostasis protein n=1 Tax=Candidatus Clostridium eludens TaxID=3381663 RepID=A0ABW8SL33_9CLOT
MSIKENLGKIKGDLNGSSAVLVAVSKTKPIEDIQKAYDLGIRDFGENKVQEFISKEQNLPKDIRWHLIGHLQRNKVKYIVGKVYLIHSLDSVKLLQELEKHYKSEDLIANVLLQINIGREASKTGVALENLQDLIQACEKCTNIKVKGLMSVIPIGDEESCRYYFQQMKCIFEDLKNGQFNNISMEILSMGMTHDYKMAVEEGSTLIRIGEGIFGKRNYNNK